MPPRDNELPEGTDHIINGAMETEGSAPPTGGGGGGLGGGAGIDAGGGATSGGFVAPSGGDDTGGTAGGGSGGQEAGAADQLRRQAFQLRDQGLERARDFAEGGKTRASDALEELSRVFADTADSIDERLGRDYGEYARRASDAVGSFADTLRRKDVDELYGNVSDAVRKSPGVALGIAAVAGFALARVIKAGLSEGGGAIGSGTRSETSGGGGTLGSGTRSGSSDGGGTIGSGTRSGGTGGTEA